MNNNKYSSVWLLLVQFVAKEGIRFNDLIDSEGREEKENYEGAWANVIVKANSISEAIEITPKGLAEKNFKMVFIDKAENLNSLIENKELDNSVVNEVDWLLSTEFVFMISDKVFPFTK